LGGGESILWLIDLGRNGISQHGQILLDVACNTQGLHAADLQKKRRQDRQEAALFVIPIQARYKLQSFRARFPHFSWEKVQTRVARFEASVKKASA
jgi:hypothetical protein